MNGPSSYEIYYTYFNNILNDQLYTGIGGSQCRHASIIRNPIGCSILDRGGLKKAAFSSQGTINHVKQDLLDD
jgi:hypothetical protein